MVGPGFALKACYNSSCNAYHSLVIISSALTKGSFCMLETSESFLHDLLERLDTWPAGIEAGAAMPHLSAERHPYPRLFEPIQVNEVWIKNRIVMGPMGNISMAEEMGRPANKMIQYFTARARGGVGLITSGLVPISQKVDPTVTEVGDRSYFPRIDGSRTVFSGWRELAENVHAFGARFFIQLTPGLGRVGSPESLLKKYQLPISASWNPNFYLPSVPCRPLTDGECRAIIHAAGQASADAKALTIDGVYLHGHEGYLLEQMTNPAFNRRKLGRYADWQAFGLDLVREIRKRVGPRYPIMYRIDLSLALNATYGEHMHEAASLRLFRSERSVAQTLDYMLNLVKAGVDLFDVDLGSYDNWWLPHPPNSLPSGCYRAVARLVKEYFAHHQVRSNTGMEVPIVAVGKLGYPDLAEETLSSGDCDMVMLARPLLADPEWPNKAQAGRVGEIVPCIGDQEACINEFVEGGHPQCSVNPRTGFEDVYPAALIPAERPRRIGVVGAGPAGIACATLAARRGHRVTLIEARDQVGGMLVPGSLPKIKYEVGNYLASLRGQLERAVREDGLELLLNTPATPEMLKALELDALVICAGGRPVTPMLPGISLPHVIQAVDLLRSPSCADAAKRVVIIGGGSVGCECAQYLAVERGKPVTVVEMLPYFMKGVCTANRGHLIHLLEKFGVRLLNCTRLKEITPDGARVLRNRSKSVPSPFKTWNPVLPDNIPNPLARPIREEMEEEVLPADLVVLAMGLKPDRAIYEACLRASAAPVIYNAGDAFQTGRVFEAVKAGFALGTAV
jgi:2-enoate reductase